jgi:bifunctional non-homologous end joining protein LigD
VPARPPRRPGNTPAATRDPLAEYRRKRDPARTAEPVPAADQPLPVGNDDTFVVQEHHTPRGRAGERVHWDLRLERDGVLKSWAVPKGPPLVPDENRLAVPTEDHPLEYASFAGTIAAGEYGGGEVAIWDAGHYETEKWDERHIIVTFAGERLTGRYVLFPLKDRAWNLKRLDPAPAHLPAKLTRPGFLPMLASPGELPSARDDAWGYEFKWDGVRALAYVAGGQVTLRSRKGEDITVRYPEVGALPSSLVGRDLVVDGEIVALDEQGRPDFGALQNRMHRTGREVRGLAEAKPVTYLVFDLLAEGETSLLDRPYAERRERLDDLAPAGKRWVLTPWFPGGGAEVLAASLENGLEGVVAKRLDSTYRPGARALEWV